ncbi:MAG TPA: helix-turn-helix transcriptional regulator [Dehalococcoidia bacterium]|nr:helix-turn-helix transcriptional regulator [Dehalococcoidia bacterium]
MTFGAYLHEQRVAHNVNRADFAARAGITPAQLHELELNHRLPSCAELDRIAAALEVPAVLLMAQAGYVRLGGTRAG